MSFTLDLRRYAKKTNANMSTLVREVVLELGARIVERSPVGNPSLWLHPNSAPPGYVGGRFRGNWQYKFGTPPTGDLPTVDASGRESLSRIQAGVSEAPGAGMHYLANNLPYAQALEEGHSTQAPGGMVELAVIDFKAILREAARNL